MRERLDYPRRVAGLSAFPKAPAVAALRVWHPWLRLQRLICVIRSTRWNDDERAIVRGELDRAIAEKRRIARAGWFN